MCNAQASLYMCILQLPRSPRLGARLRCRQSPRLNIHMHILTRTPVQISLCLLPPPPPRVLVQSIAYDFNTATWNTIACRTEKHTIVAGPNHNLNTHAHAHRESAKQEISAISPVLILHHSHYGLSDKLAVLTFHKKTSLHGKPQWFQTKRGRELKNPAMCYAASSVYLMGSSGYCNVPTPSFGYRVYRSPVLSYGHLVMRRTSFSL